MKDQKEEGQIFFPPLAIDTESILNLKVGCSLIKTIWRL